MILIYSTELRKMRGCGTVIVLQPRFLNCLMSGAKRQADEGISSVSQKKGDVQQIIVIMEIAEGETDTQFRMVAEKLGILSDASATYVCVRFNFDGDNVILPLDNEVYLIGGIVLRPVTGCDIELR